MKISDLDLRIISDEDPGMLTHAPELATELLKRRREVRRLRAALRELQRHAKTTAYDDDDDWMQRLIRAALKPQRGGK